MEKTEFNIIDEAVKEVLRVIKGKLSDIAFSYDAEEERYDIVHNFYDRFFTDDDFANTVSTILFEKLDKKGVSNYGFYADEQLLSALTLNYEEEISNTNQTTISRNENLFKGLEKESSLFYNFYAEEQVPSSSGVEWGKTAPGEFEHSWHSALSMQADNLIRNHGESFGIDEMNKTYTLSA